MNVFFGIFNPAGCFDNLDSKKMHEVLLNSEYDKSSEYLSETFVVSEYVSVDGAMSRDKQSGYHETDEWVVAGNLSLSYREYLLDKLGLYGTIGSTKTDAELVLLAFIKWGNELVYHIEGEWCFLIYDKKKNELNVFKDFSGVTSFYYLLKDKVMYFSSFSSVLSKAFKTYLSPDLQSILRITSLKFIPHGGNTVFDNLKSLVPGQRLAFSPEISFSVHNYFPQKFDKGPRYKYLDDDLEDFNQLYFGAVKEIVGKGKKSALFLSGGKDSSSVAYYMSQHGKYTGETYQAYSAIPAYEIKEEFVGNKIYDESGFVREMISDYPNMEIKTMDFKEESLVLAFQDQFDLNAFFPVVTKNSYWLKGILKEGRKSGTDTFVTGQMGNFTITSNSFYLYADKLKHLDVAGIIASFLHEKRTWNVGIGYFIKHYLLIPLKQLWSLHQRALITEHRKFEYTCVKKNLCSDFRKVTFKNYLNILGNFFTRNASLRHELLKINLEFSGNVWSHLAVCHGVQIFDPTSDYRLISFLYSIPQNLFFQNRTSKFLFRKLMKGKIPEKILQNNQYQNQSFDFPLKLVSDKEFHHFFESAVKDIKEDKIFDFQKITQAYHESMHESEEVYNGVKVNLLLNNFSVYLFLKSEN